MTEHTFDKEYWENRWQQGSVEGPRSMGKNRPNPHLAREVAHLTPGTALDAGCGGGAEATWLAMAGWQVTAADISAEALAIAKERAASSGAADRLRWIEADLSVWEPSAQFNLVMTHYAHPAIPQLEFYDRIAAWVAPGGTLLIVGHLHDNSATSHGHDHDHGHPPAEASATAATITERVDPAAWQLITADEVSRTMTAPDGREVSLRDVVVRATRIDTSRG